MLTSQPQGRLPFRVAHGFDRSVVECETSCRVISINSMFFSRRSHHAFRARQGGCRRKRVGNLPAVDAKRADFNCPGSAGALRIYFSHNLKE